jgi:hypothetical protein
MNTLKIYFKLIIKSEIDCIETGLNVYFGAEIFKNMVEYRKSCGCNDPEDEDELESFYNAHSFFFPKTYLNLKSEKLLDEFVLPIGENGLKLQQVFAPNSKADQMGRRVSGS